MHFDDLTDVGAFTQTPMDELPEQHSIQEASGDHFDDAEEIMGDTPETYELHRGNLVHDGHLCLDRPDDQRLWVIDGNVKVSGTICLTCWDTYNVVIITGDLQAGALVLDSDVHLYVKGATTLSGPFVAKLSDAGFVHLDGPTRATTYVVDNEASIHGDPDTVGEIDAAAFPEHAALIERLKSGVWRE